MSEKVNAMISLVVPHIRWNPQVYNVHILSVRGINENIEKIIEDINEKFGSCFINKIHAKTSFRRKSSDIEIRSESGDIFTGTDISQIVNDMLADYNLMNVSRWGNQSVGALIPLVIVHNNDQNNINNFEEIMNKPLELCFYRTY